MHGYITNIESMGLVDGPGIRTVVFLGGCKLRCKYCENPEGWNGGTPNITVEELVNKILRNKPYFKRNSGGVTFSGGEPLLQYDFLLAVCRRLKKEKIHIALDTAGVGLGNYAELLEFVDLVLLDIKHTDESEYVKLTGHTMEAFWAFLKALNTSGKDVWIRQVIVPDINDTDAYMKDLALFLKNVKNVKRVDFLPYHKLGDAKYDALNLSNPYREKIAMSKEKTDELYQIFKAYYGEELPF